MAFQGRRFLPFQLSKVEGSIHDPWKAWYYIPNDSWDCSYSKTLTMIKVSKKHLLWLRSEQTEITFLLFSGVRYTRIKTESSTNPEKTNFWVGMSIDLVGWMIKPKDIIVLWQWYLPQSPHSQILVNMSHQCKGKKYAPVYAVQNKWAWAIWWTFGDKMRGHWGNKW